jgi:hypothetical protein
MSDNKIGTVGPIQVWCRDDSSSATGVVYVLHSSVTITGVQGVRVEIVLTSAEFAALAGMIRYEQGFKS